MSSADKGAMSSASLTSATRESGSTSTRVRGRGLSGLGSATAMKSSRMTSSSSAISAADIAGELAGKEKGVGWLVPVQPERRATVPEVSEASELRL
eukprot:15451160-Alexandrium_andersonii.AAC.1